MWNDVGPVINGPAPLGYDGTCVHDSLPPYISFEYLDCEMFHTAYGLVLITAPVVLLDGQLLYDRLVRPENYSTDLTPWFQQ
jgi:hypothetical protein